MNQVQESIQFTFANEVYANGKKSRIFKNVKEGVEDKALIQVGEATSQLQGDDLGDVFKITKTPVAKG